MNNFSIFLVNGLSVFPYEWGAYAGTLGHALQFCSFFILQLADVAYLVCTPMKSSANRTRFQQVRHLGSFYRYLLESDRTNLGVFYFKLPGDVPILVRWERPTICAPA